MGISTSWESSADSQEWRRHSAAEGRDFKSQDNIWAQSEAEEAEGSIRQSGSIKAYLDGWRARTLSNDSFQTICVHASNLCFLWYVILKWIQNPKCICNTCMGKFIFEHLLPDGHWHKKTTGKASFLFFAAHSLVFPILFELCRVEKFEW